MDKIDSINVKNQSNPGMKVQGLLLDLDGTLANSLSVMQLVYHQFLENFNILSSGLEFESFNGPPIPVVVQRLKEKYALPGNLDQLIEKYCTYLDNAYLNVTPNPGAEALMSTAKQAQCFIGVVTSNTAVRTKAWLKKVNLAHFIDVLVAQEDVVNGKPSKEPYQLATLRLQCPKESIIAVEDSPQGATSASSAGIRTFVLNAEPDKHLWPDGVKLISSLSQLLELFL